MQINLDRMPIFIAFSGTKIHLTSSYLFIYLDLNPQEQGAESNISVHDVSLLLFNMSVFTSFTLHLIINLSSML